MFARITLLVAALAAGCNGYGYHLRNMSPDELQTVDAKWLALAYYDLQDPEVVAEIDRRALFTERDWELVHERKIGVGMSRLALYASWGQPSGETLHEAPGGYRMQHAYGGYDGHSFMPMSFVYSSNDRITGWSQ